MDKIRILGSNYQLDMNSDMSDRGEADFTGQKIRIQKDLTLDQKMSTILHEILEVINYDFELKLEHKVINQIECGFKTVFSDNQELKDILFPQEDTPC